MARLFSPSDALPGVGGGKNSEVASYAPANYSRDQELSKNLTDSESFYSTEDSLTERLGRKGRKLLLRKASKKNMSLVRVGSPTINERPSKISIGGFLGLLAPGKRADKYQRAQGEEEQQEASIDAVLNPAPATTTDIAQTVAPRTEEFNGPVPQVKFGNLAMEKATIQIDAEEDDEHCTESDSCFQLRISDEESDTWRTNAPSGTPANVEEVLRLANLQPCSSCGKQGFVRKDGRANNQPRFKCKAKDQNGTVCGKTYGMNSFVTSTTTKERKRAPTAGSQGAQQHVNTKESAEEHLLQKQLAEKEGELIQEKRRRESAERMIKQLQGQLKAEKQRVQQLEDQVGQLQSQNEDLKTAFEEVDLKRMRGREREHDLRQQLERLQKSREMDEINRKTAKQTTTPAELRLAASESRALAETFTVSARERGLPSFAQEPRAKPIKVRQQQAGTQENMELDESLQETAAILRKSSRKSLKKKTNFEEPSASADPSLVMEVENEKPTTNETLDHPKTRPSFADIAKRRIEERKAIPYGVEALKALYYQPPAPRRPQPPVISKVSALYFANVKCGPIGDIRFRLRKAGIATSHILEIAFINRRITEMIVSTDMAETVISQLAQVGILNIPNYNPLVSLTRIKDPAVREKIRSTFAKRLSSAAERISNTTTKEAFLRYSNTMAPLLSLEPATTDADTVDGQEWKTVTQGKGAKQKKAPSVAKSPSA